VAEAEEAAEDTGAVAASAQAPWVASAEVILVVVVLAEATWMASAGVAWRSWAEIITAMEDVVSAAITATASVRTTRHTTVPTAPTE
jgi:hypothetical protein